jgi:hypothetical protein
MRFLSLILIIWFLIACTAEPYREYNSDDEEMQDCLKSFEGMHGYCEAVIYRSNVVD